MIESPEYNSGKTGVKGPFFLPAQPGTESKVSDDITLAQVRLNPELLKEKQKDTSDNQSHRPIWESPKAEIYSSSPGLKRVVIWKYDPNEEGVIKFNSFDSLDPLPHHYYKTNQEYEEALRIYKCGKMPDMLIDLNEYNWEHVISQRNEEVTVFPEINNKILPRKISKAA
jgi:hypothetical protein